MRTDPIFDGFSDELEGVLACEPDVVMLPYFKTVREVETFIKAVDGRATTSLLLETREAAEQIDDIISVGGIDEIHIGLNDLSHSYGKSSSLKNWRTALWTDSLNASKPTGSRTTASAE